MPDQHAEPRQGPPSATVVARTVGIAFVVYSFLWALWADRHGQRFDLIDEMREWVNQPLGIGEDFGPLGIMLLLLASGFTATSRPAAELPKRLVRVFLPLLVGAIAATCMIALGATPLLALGWVLVVELISALTGALTARLGGHSAWLVPLGQLVVVGLLVLVGEPVGHLALILSYLPIAVVGQLLGSYRAHRAPGWALLLLGLAAWGLVAWAEQVFAQLNGWWYPLAACYAVLFFATTTRMTLTARKQSVAGRLAARSRWLLVFAGTVGWAALDLAAGPLPFPLAATLATVVVVLAAELAFRGSAVLAGRPRQGATA